MSPSPSSGRLAKSEGSIWVKASTNGGGAWLETDELLDIVYWMRQGIGLVMGVLLGLVGWTGFTGFIVFGLATAWIPVRYYRDFLGIDEDDFGGSKGLVAEGTYPSLAVFVLCWMTIYGFLHSKT
mmetsp:Transcript_8290/g.16838  ORF Transcript_8290/g.16838 Transcript_8290/m.16838 type:complete len:125 (+) Transcript_8290:178-552(+)